MKYKGFAGFGKRSGFSDLTAEEEKYLEQCSDQEKKAFFDTKKYMMIRRKNEQKKVIDKLILGERLDAREEFVRLELIDKFQKKSLNNSKFNNTIQSIIIKLLAGDELSSQELYQTQLIIKCRESRKNGKNNNARMYRGYGIGVIYGKYAYNA